MYRAWFFQSFALKNGSLDWSAFDNTLAVARAKGVYLTVTLADHWGACEPGTAKPESWYTTTYRDVREAGTDNRLIQHVLTYRQYVQEIVSRYRNEPAIAMWQLMNEAETTCTTAGLNALRAFADDVGGLIQSIDPNHLVSLGTLGGQQCPFGGTGFTAIHMSPAIDVCEVHDYEGDAAMPALIQTRIDQCNTIGKPMVIGELGRPGSNYSSLQARANVFAAKIDAAFNAGVDVYQLWNLDDSRLGSVNCTTSYGICPSDPAIAVLEARD